MIADAVIIDTGFVHGQLNRHRHKLDFIDNEIDHERWASYRPRKQQNQVRLMAAGIIHGFASAREKQSSQGTELWGHAVRIGRLAAGYDFLGILERVVESSGLLSIEKTTMAITNYSSGLETATKSKAEPDFAPFDSNNVRLNCVVSVLARGRSAIDLSYDLLEGTPEAKDYITAVMNGLKTDGLVTDDRETIGRRTRTPNVPGSWLVTPLGSEWLHEMVEIGGFIEPSDFSAMQ